MTETNNETSYQYNSDGLINLGRDLAETYVNDIAQENTPSQLAEIGKWPIDPADIQMIIADVDDTIVDANSGKDFVSMDLVEAFHVFEKLGGTIGFATGRSWSMMKHLTENLMIAGPQTIERMENVAKLNNQPTMSERHWLGYYISHNLAAVDGGARIVDMDGNTLWGESIDSEILPQITADLTEMGLDSVFWSEDGKDFSRQDLEVGWDLKDLDLSHKVYFLGVRALNMDRPTVTDIANKLMAKYSMINVGVAEAQYNPGFCDLHITSKDATKQRAAHMMMQMAKADSKETLAAGDGGNDIKLFEACGVRYAVGNAVESLKSQADIIGPAVKKEQAELVHESEPHGFTYLLDRINQAKYKKIREILSRAAA